MLKNVFAVIWSDDHPVNTTKIFDWPNGARLTGLLFVDRYKL